MALPITKKILDTSTEYKIKEAARKVFHMKGFAGTRTRDIAEEAGINLALLNYYFRSKEKLFEIIMLETMMKFMQSIVLVFNDESTSLEQKIENIASGYIDMLLGEPEIPLFIMSELRMGNAAHLFEKIHIKEILMKSVFAKQYKEAVELKRINELPFIQFIMNLMGLCVFPFIACPMLKLIGDMNDKQFQETVTERKKLIPIWISAMIKFT